MPDAERVLWSRLKNKQQEGLRFRRQHTIGPYVVGFACLEIRLVVELDGGQHFEDEAIESDKRRDAFLTKAGWTVLRFVNNDVFKRLRDVLDGIVLTARTAPPPSATPTPPPLKRGRKD